MEAEESSAARRTYRNVHQHRTWHPELDRLAFDKAEPVGSAEERQQSDTGTSADDVPSAPGWPLQHPVWPRTVAAEERIGLAGMDSHSNWRYRRMAVARYREDMAGTLGPCWSSPSCTKAEVVLVLAFVHSYIADMRLAEQQHHRDIH